MTRINTNILSLKGQIGLRRSNAALSESLERLSSGLRINTGKDDPAGLIASEVLRSEIVAINQSITNSERANNVIATADAALGEVSKLLNDIRGLVQASANDGAISDAEVAANQDQLDSAIESIVRIGQTTVFGGEKLLNGTKAFSVNAVGGSLSPFSSTADLNIKSFNPALHTDTAGDDVQIAVNSAATKRTVEIKGTDLTAGNGVGLSDLSLGTSTRTTTTLDGRDNNVSNGISLDSLSSNSTRANRVITGNGGAGAGLEDLGGTGADTVTFTITGNLGTQTGVVVNVAAVQADSQALADAINAVSDTTGVLATTAGGAGADVTVTSATIGTGGSVAIAATAADNAGDDTAFDAAVGAQNNGTDGADVALELTVTGDRGSAVVTIADNDTIINNSQVLVDAINTVSATTGVTASLVANTGYNNGNTGADVLLTSSGFGASAQAGIAATGVSASADQTLIANGSTNVTSLGSDGTSNTTTLEIIGDLGRSVVTFNNDAVINDSSALVSVINSVSSQTGVTATGSGNQGDVTLTSRNFGSNAVLTVNAIAQSAAGSADITLFNAAATQLAIAGTDTVGTITHALGGGNFSANGEVISFTDTNLTLNGTTTPSLAASTTATTTIQDTTAGAGGLDSLTGTGTQTIDFTVTGSRGSANINGINVAALKANSQVLVDSINAQSITTGVRASLSGNDIVLSSIVSGATGSVSINATASTNGTDHAVFNNADTFTNTVAGSASTTTASFDVTGGALFQLGPIVAFSNQVNINIPSLDAATLGRNFSTTGGNALAALKTGGTHELKLTANLTEAASIVEQAITEIAILRGELGSLQKNVIASNISSLQASLENVTAAESRIRDTDFAVETANLTRAQILVQAGTAVLGAANSNPQNVLALLG